MKKNVLMLGPARNVKGGMTTVINNYYEASLDKMINLKYIETINDKDIIQKVLKMIMGFFQFLINLQKYDIVHIHMASRMSTFRKGVYVRIAKKFNKKVIIHMHGAEYKIFYENECSNKKKKYVHRTLNFADKVIVLSEEWKEFFSKLINENKIEIVYNSILLPEDFKKNVDTKKILFLGRLGKRKGIYDLIDVIEKIVQEENPIQLYIGGDGEVEKIKKIIHGKGLEKNIEYIGWISGKEKYDFLKKCSFYILPSYNEGMPMSVLEAMAYKNITITTNVGGIPKIIQNEENGILIQPGDKETLYNFIIKLLEDKKLREKLSNNARRTIEEKFNINKMMEKILLIYTQIMDENTK